MDTNTNKVMKDSERELPVPEIWRPRFIEIVNAFVKKDYSLQTHIDNVSPVSTETAKHIKDYIDDYGEVLTTLPVETWESSIYIWMGTYWEVIIDLWTVGEGCSDLILSARVSENYYVIEIGMVYVP